MPDTAVHLGADAAAGDGGKILRGRNPQTFRSGFFHNSLRQRVLASGSAAAARGETPFGKAVVQQITSVTEGWPEVMVPVLSSTMVSMECRFSRLSADLMRMPYSAAFPVPTMMATGVASPARRGRR